MTVLASLFLMILLGTIERKKSTGLEKPNTISASDNEKGGPCGPPSIYLVAGEGFEPPAFRL